MYLYTMSLYLQNLSLLNFKNYEDLNLTFGEGIHCLLGHNGEGKTNVLDAIHYMSFAKSAFQSADSMNIRHGAPFFVVQGSFRLDGHDENIYCGFKKGTRKQVKRNQKDYERLAEHIGLLPVVMISPYDMDLVTGVSEDRRRFMDSVIAQYDREYLENLMAYNRLLSQRNALLKHMAIEGKRQSDTLDILNLQMEKPALHVYAKRQEFLQGLVPVFQSYYERLAGGREQVSVEFQSHLHDDQPANLFRDSLPRDLALQYTSKGVHKDDLLFKLGEHPVKRIGSQGQQKTFLIALKLAQYAFMRTRKEVKPILMIDDVFDKLDENRVSQLMSLVTGSDFGQVFITDAHTARLPAILRGLDVPARHYHVKSGGVITEKEQPLEEKQ